MVSNFIGSISGFKAQHQKLTKLFRFNFVLLTQISFGQLFWFYRTMLTPPPNFPLTLPVSPKFWTHKPTWEMEPCDWLRKCKREIRNHCGEERERDWSFLGELIKDQQGKIEKFSVLTKKILLFWKEKMDSLGKVCSLRLVMCSFRNSRNSSTKHISNHLIQYIL